MESLIPNDGVLFICSNVAQSPCTDFWKLQVTIDELQTISAVSTGVRQPSLVIALLYSLCIQLQLNISTGVNPAADTSPNILVGGTSTGISPQYYYLLSDIADQYWLPIRPFPLNHRRGWFRQRLLYILYSALFFVVILCYCWEHCVLHSLLLLHLSNRWTPRPSFSPPADHAKIGKGSQYSITERIGFRS